MWETARLGLGAFLTSPGFGGLAALVAAAVAYVKLRSDLRAGEQARAEAEAVRRDDEHAARQSEQRARWMSAFLWLSEAHAKAQIDEEGLVDGLRALKELVTTEEQRAMLAVAEGMSR